MLKRYENPTFKTYSLKVHRLLVERFASMDYYNHTLYKRKEYAEEVFNGIKKFYDKTYKKYRKTLSSYMKLYRNT